VCGIAGFWSLTPQSDNLAALQRMLSVIEHRGPDGKGVWHSANDQVALGHRRLSILDLSPSGAQPMSCASGRFVVTYNGEIYNHLDLRQQLKSAGCDVAWRGTSDTETLVECIDFWGVEKTLSKLNGMFGLAVFNTESQTLTLARDRLGEKPLYYGWFEGKLVFASEIKSVNAFTEKRLILNSRVLSDYLQFNNIPAPHSIYQNVFKLPPAHFIQFDASLNQQTQPSEYWSLLNTAAHGLQNPMQGSELELTDALEAQLSESVQSRMQSDVPLGAFLSGGIDSSVVVALMQKSSAKPVNTFSIGFDVEKYNEAPFAAEVAKHLGTHHRELYVSSKDAMDAIPKLASIWDEPFADSSQLPTYLVSALTREHVTVALSGDGGDELFGGYRRYQESVHLWNRISRMPGFIRGPSNALSALAFKQLRGAAALWPFGSTHKFNARCAHLEHLMNLVGSRSHSHLYELLLSQWLNPNTVIRGAKPSTYLSNRFDELASKGFAEPVNSMMYCDAATYLHDTIMCKVDRASMAVSLETRAPLLDHELVEFAWKVPLAQKIHASGGKHLLRNVLYRHVPQALIDRPKKGFSLPIGDWLRTPLRDWAEDLISTQAIEEFGVLNAKQVRHAWDLHSSSQWDMGGPLWNVLMLQAWLRESR